MKQVFQALGYSVSEYFRSLDKLLLVVSLLLSSFGLVMIHTATYSSAKHDRCILIQSIAIGLGLIFIFILSKVRYDFFCRFSPAIVVGSFLLLLVTSVVAEDQSGNKSWLNFGPVNIQPAEFMKLALILTLSYHLSCIREQMNQPKHLCFLIVHFCAYLIPVFFQGELGSALVYIGIFIVMLFLAGLKYRYIIIASVLTVGAAPILWKCLKDYHRQRILFSLYPELDPLGFGYQPLLSKIALGSGQLFGMGYGQGIQTQNELLPASHTDFIFAIVGEEFGFFGCLFLIAGLLLLLFLIIRNARLAKDFLGRMICIGIAAMLGTQILINIGMCLGVSPVIGITLPFISYGGSSALSVYLAIGFVESVHMKPDRSLRFGNRSKMHRP